MLNKLGVTKDDKDKLLQLISDLDYDKNKDIKRTVKDVDRNFNEIFSILLPNTSCRLDPKFSDDSKEVLVGL